MSCPLPGVDLERWRAARRFALAACICGATTLVVGCQRSEPERKRSAVRPLAGTAALDRSGGHLGGAPRQRVASARVRFVHAHAEPGSNAAGFDRLAVDAVFADALAIDAGVVDALVGTHAQHHGEPAAQGTCTHLRAPAGGAGGEDAIAPRGYVRLLDVGNVTLEAGARRAPLQIEMVPTLFRAVRGVRYRLQLDDARAWLAAGEISLRAPGGDGTGPVSASVPVPRPLRVTHVGSEPVRHGLATLAEEGADLHLRWGSVLAGGDVALTISAEDEAGGRTVLSCNVPDTGRYVLAASWLEQLPSRLPDRPWLLEIARSTEQRWDTFERGSLTLVLIDRVRLLAADKAANNSALAR